jgi:hypothetical protein
MSTIARLFARAEGDKSLDRACTALRRQRKPIRQMVHRAVLLKHLRLLAPVLKQVVQALAPRDADTDADARSHSLAH